jgi:hypothetical protein
VIDGEDMTTFFSDRDIYIKVDGEKFIVRSHTKLDLETKALVFLNI